MNPTRLVAGPRRSIQRSGTAAVEFALAAPILFMILFASLELSRMNLIRQTANNAAYEAARNCTVPGGNVTDAQAAGQRILNSIGVTGSSITVSPNPILTDTATVTVTVTVPIASNLWSQALFAVSGSITSSCQLTRDWVVSTKQ